jgi:hypothetical protein
MKLAYHSMMVFSLVALFLVGCQLPTESQAPSGGQASVVEGKIVSMEEGILYLRMPSGVVREFYFRDMEQIDRLWGRSLDSNAFSGVPCRVYFKQSVGWDGVGNALRTQEITNFEWL